MMVKDLHTSEEDILSEKYQGAHPAIAAAGEAYYAHYWMALVGLIGGGIATYVFHKPVGKLVNGLRGHAEKWVTNNDNVAARWTGKTIHGIFGTGEEYSTLKDARARLKSARTSGAENPMLEGLSKDLVYKEKGFGFWLFDHTIGLYKPAKEWIKKETKGNEQISMAITSGGLLGAIGFFIAPWVYATKGVHNANQGKDQFKRAQQEILELREDLQFLDNKNAELRQEIREIKESPLNVSRDDTPAVRDTEVAPQQPEVLTKRKDDETNPAAEKDDTDEPTRETNHADRHKKAGGKSHSETIRTRQAEAAEQPQSLSA